MHVVQSVASRKYLVSRRLVDEARTTLARVPVVIAEMVEARIRNGAPHARLVDRNADDRCSGSRSDPPKVTSKDAQLRNAMHPALGVGLNLRQTSYPTNRPHPQQLK